MFTVHRLNKRSTCCFEWVLCLYLDLDLVFLPLVLMVCQWLFYEIPMNWFIDAQIMEQKTGYLSDKSNLWLELLKKFSIKDWKNNLCNRLFGSKKVRGTWWRKLLLLWIIGWFLGSLWIFWFMNSQAVEKRREMLASMCDERARMLQDQFNVSMNHLQALAILISTFHHAKDPSAIDQVLPSTWNIPTFNWIYINVYLLSSPNYSFSDLITIVMCLILIPQKSRHALL